MDMNRLFVGYFAAGLIKDPAKNMRILPGYLEASSNVRRFSEI